MIGLTREGCAARQRRLRDQLVALKLDGALITDPGHVMYFTNFWARAILPRAMLILADGPVVLSTHEIGDFVAADELRVYESNKLATLVDDLPLASITPLLEWTTGWKDIGCDAPVRPWALDGIRIHSLAEPLYQMRRHKDADELDMIRLAVKGTEAAYAAAREVLAPGVTELHVFTTMYSAAVEAVGEPIGEMGNDFRAGEPGGAPRVRPVEAGELMPLDNSTVVRGYTCDLCRTLSVDRRPTDAQLEAHSLVMSVLEHVEHTVKPGVSCRKLYDEAVAMIDGHRGWRFSHHLGHAIGLFGHERPRLNPNWDDTFEVGDVFTAEPGLYGHDLRAGIRIENNYLVTETGLEKLSLFPTDL